MFRRLPPPERLLLAAGLFGLTSVALGAIGAHSLKAPLLERGMLQAWETAARYHLFHAIALLGAGAWLRSAQTPRTTQQFVWAGRCWSLGIVLFSGSLYWLALGGPRWLGPITPLGGIAFLVGWLLLILAAFNPRS